jgi:hypothetical protein
MAKTAAVLGIHLLHAKESATRLRRVAGFLGLDPDWIEHEMKQVVQQAHALWPTRLRCVA